MRHNPRFPILLIQALLVLSAASSVLIGAGAEEGRAGARGVILIHDVFELQNMSKDLNGSYELANDIDASVTKDWNGGKGFAPVGTNFMGSLDGHGYSITGLFINRPEEVFVGLFSLTSPASTGIRNLTLTSVNVTGDNFVGAVVGNNSCPVTDCIVSGSVHGGFYVGGVVGMSQRGAISGCSFSGVVSGREYVGGVVASSWNVENCHNAGSITATGDKVGGVVAENWKGSVHDCYNTGPVNGVNWAGGLIGNNIGNVSKCFNTGPVTGTDVVGGLIGENSNSNGMMGIISDSYNTGSVSGNDIVGGLTAYHWFHDPGPGSWGAVISRCYSAGHVQGATRTGGLLGICESTVTDCYWDVDTSGYPSGLNGTGKTTAEMKKQATFAGWDFDTVWDIHEGSSYPFLRAMPAVVGNRSPLITNSPWTMASTETRYEFQLQGLDPDGDQITWSMTTNASWLAMNASGFLQGTPSESDGGKYSVAVTASDGHGGNTNLAFEIIVFREPHTLSWSSVPDDRALQTGEYFSFDASAVDSDPARVISYSVHSFPDCGLIIDNATGAIRWRDVPSPGDSSADNQTFAFNLIAYDGGRIINHWFNLTIIGKPEPSGPVGPHIMSAAGPDNVTVKSSSVQTFSVEARSPTNATLTYDWKENNVTLSTEKSFSRKFPPGNHSLVLLIGDGHYVTTRTFNFTVAPPPKTIEAKPVSVPGFGAAVAAAAVITVVAIGLFWRRERR